MNGSSFDKHVGLLNMYYDAGFTISTALDKSTCLLCKYTWTIFYGYMSNCQRAAVVLPGGPQWCLLIYTHHYGTPARNISNFRLHTHHYWFREIPHIHTLENYHKHLQNPGYYHGYVCWFTPFPPVTIWLFNIAMENGPFIDGLPLKHSDFHSYVK